MRTAAYRLLLAAGVAAAFGAPASAQNLVPAPAPASNTIQQQMAINIQIDQLRAREAMANRQAIAVQNQLSSLDAQIRTQQSLSDIRAQSYSPTIPQYQGAPPAHIDTSQLASIPDDKLAASKQRVREAAANHH